MSRSILLLSPSGLGNLGDAAILETTIAGIAARLPQARPILMTLAPEESAARFRTEAGPLDTPGRGKSATSMPHWPEWLLRLPWGRTLWSAAGTWHGWRNSERRSGAERMHQEQIDRLLCDAALVVVAGGGQLDDFFGGPWEQPYLLAKWARHAARAGVPIAFASVGACAIESRVTRHHLRAALERAAYRSYRDAGSKRMLAALPFTALDPIVPDLVFGFPIPARPTETGAQRWGRSHPLIGISPAPRRGPHNPHGNDPRYEAHLEALAAAATRLIDGGFEVELFANHRADVAELERIRQRSPRCALAPFEDDPAKLLDRIAGYDCALVGRLHALLFTQLMAVPAAAAVWDRKIEAALADPGLDRFLMPLDSRGEAWARAALQLLEERADLSARLRAFGARARQAVEQQFDRLAQLYSRTESSPR